MSTQQALSPVKGLEILSDWLQDNVDCESGIIFDNDEDNSSSETLLPCINTVLLTLRTVSGERNNNIMKQFSQVKAAAERGEAVPASDALSLLSELDTCQRAFDLLRTLFSHPADSDE